MLKLHPKRWATCIAALAVASVSAGTVEQATITADPQMQVKDGEVQGCGYRLKSIPKSFAGQSSVVVLDTSFNLYSTGLGLLKGGALQIQIEDGKPTQATAKQIESFWLKTQAKKPTAPRNGRVVPAENAGYLLYSVSEESVLELFTGLVEGPVTVGVRIRGEAIDRIYSGAVQLSDQDREQGIQCLDDLIRQLGAAPPPKPPGR
jgi:hypothetical protein